MDVLFAWLGNTDLAAADSTRPDGPTWRAVHDRQPGELVLLSSQPAARRDHYVAWLRKHSKLPIVVRPAELRGPTHLGDIHQAAVAAIADALERHKRPRPVYHLSPGTPAMAAVWIILGKTRFPGVFIESSKDLGVRDVEVPFSLSAELLPDLLRGPDEAVERFADELPPEAPAFEVLVHRSLPMRRLLSRARRVALRSVPVLIEGESGSGKELLARAIHHASPRAKRPFIAVNCGAIPAGLIEAELFGHEKGAFTGADRARAGHFREADGGTLFLDELVELPRAAQVSLLRVLQEGEVVPVGASRPVKVDVRVIAASQRGLVGEVAAGRFRSDLYYRLAVAVLGLPALRERQGDLDLLIDHTLERINREFADDPGFVAKRLSSAARAVLHAHPWPGNVRELANTLRRAALWSAGHTLSAEEARDALVLPAHSESLGDVDLPALLAETARNHLQRAIRDSDGNKTLAARRLGLPSHQTLTNWLKRYEVEA